MPATFHTALLLCHVVRCPATGGPRQGAGRLLSYPYRSPWASFIFTYFFPPSSSLSWRRPEHDPSMATTSTLSSISLPPTVRDTSTTVPLATTSFTITISRPSAPGTPSSKSHTAEASSSSSSPTPNAPATNAAPASVVTVEVASNGGGGNNNNGQSYPLGLILGIVTGFSILVLVMGIMFLILWRSKSLATRNHDNEFRSIRKRRKWPSFAAGGANAHLLRKGSVDSTATEGDAEAALPAPPAPRRKVSKPPRGGGRGDARRRRDREAKNSARPWPTSVGTSMVPVQSPRDCDAAGAARVFFVQDCDGDNDGEPSHRPYRSQDQTLLSQSPPSAAAPKTLSHRPPLSSRRNRILAPFAAPLSCAGPTASHAFQTRRSSEPEIRTGLNPLAMHPPPLQITTPGSAAANPVQTHFRSWSSDNLACAGSEGAAAAPAPAASRNMVKPPPKHYARQLSRRRYHTDTGDTCDRSGNESFALESISKVPSDPSSDTTATTTHSRSRSRDAQQQQQQQQQQGEFFVLSPPPRRKESTLALWQHGDHDNSNHATVVDRSPQRLPVGDEDGRIDRRSGVRISGVSQMTLEGMASLAQGHDEGPDQDGRSIE